MHRFEQHSRLWTLSALVVSLVCLSATAQGAITKKGLFSPLGKAKTLAHTIHAIFKLNKDTVDPKQLKVKVTVDDQSAEVNESTPLRANHDGGKDAQVEKTHQELLNFVLTNGKSANVAVSGPNVDLLFRAYPSNSNEIVVHAQGLTNNIVHDWHHDADGILFDQK